MHKLFKAYYVQLLKAGVALLRNGKRGFTVLCKYIAMLQLETSETL